MAVAWAVHLFTSAGVVLALLALDAVLRGDNRLALVWLLAALVVDGIDGTMARAARVRERTPRIDGAALDLVIDYLTYAFIPALIIWRADVLPVSIGLPLAAAILMSSLYVFARRDMKTEDGYFRGFPALWNIVAFYFVVAPPTPMIAATLAGSLIVLTFAPVHVAHPFRARDYGALLPALATAWAASSGVLLVPGLDAPLRQVMLGISLVTAAAIVGMGLLRTLRGPRAKPDGGISRPGA